MNFNYHPEGLYVWDTWYFNYEGVTHCIHLQQPRPGCNREPREFGALGHAMSEDLVKWTEAPIALYPGEPGTYDDMGLWTGSTIEHNGLLYMFYTARSSVENGVVNRIALATSHDGFHWKRHPDNPLIVPDPRWYCTEGAALPVAGHAWGMVDCRDLAVIPDPEGDGYYGFFAARIPAKELAASSVIACCKSDDLIHWEQLPPCFVPKKYACIEVPEVFYLDGRWYLICLTGNSYGQRNRYSDSNLRFGTIYAVSDRPTGPFYELDDNVLIGSLQHQGFSCRTLEKDGKRYLFYTQGESMDGSNHGTITTPKELRTDSEGRLLACYAPHIERYAGERFLAGPQFMIENRGQWGSIGAWQKDINTVTAECETDWSLAIFDVEGQSFIYEANIKTDTARGAGLVFRVNGDDVLGGAYAVLLDYSEQEVIFTETRHFPRIEARRWKLERGRVYHVRIVAKQAVFEVFLDDILVLQLYHSKRITGRLGLIVEQGSAEFSQINAVELIYE